MFTVMRPKMRNKGFFVLADAEISYPKIVPIFFFESSFLTFLDSSGMLVKGSSGLELAM